MTTTSSPTTQPPSLTPLLPISQEELADLERGRQVAKNTERLRKSIVNRLQAGASVELGHYSVRIKQIYSRRISRRSLEQLWGLEYVEQLRMNVPETVTSQLVVNNNLEADFY